MRKRSLITSLLVVLVLLGATVLFQAARSDGSSETIVEAIEKVRQPGYVRYIIHEHPVDDGVIVFLLRELEDHSFSIAAEYVRKARFGWKWGHGSGLSGSYKPDDKSRTDGWIRAEYFGSTAEWGIESPFPIIYGVSHSADTARVVVKNTASGLERQSTMVEIKEGFKLFYSLLDEAEGSSFEITGYDKAGAPVGRYIIRGLNESGEGWTVGE